MLKKFFILRCLLSFLLFAISFFLFKLIQFFIPIKLFASLISCIIALLLAFFLSSVLSTILTFMQIYYAYQEDAAVILGTLLHQFIQSLKSLFEKDNCYLKLLFNLKKADSCMKDKLYDALEEDNPYSCLLEYRNNFLFKFFIDNLTNKILICTFFYVVKTDSDLEIEDYAKGAVFYSKVFPYLLEATFKADILINFIASIFYIVISLLTLLTCHSFIALPLLLIFHKMILSFVINHYTLSFLEKSCESKDAIEETTETEQDCDNATDSIETILESDNVEQSIPCIKAKSSLSDIAKVKSNDFSMPNKLSSFTNAGQSNLNSLLNQWKNNNSTSKGDTSSQVKSAHKYFKLDEERIKQITSYNDEDNLNSSSMQCAKTLSKDLFVINDIYIEAKNLNIDFLLNIDEY